MTIKILFFAELKEIFGQSRFMNVPEESTVSEVVNLLTLESEKLHSKKESLLYAINENLENAEKILRNGDELALMTPMSGG